MPWPIEFVNFMVLGFGFYLLHGCIQVYVTELAPSARGSATAAHSFFFFLGQAAGPVVYGLGLDTVGVTPVLLLGAAILAAAGWVCALRLKHPAIDRG
jgi:predicted MFS family arabinose efflux permease